MAYNEVLFFDTSDRHRLTVCLYTDACLYGLGGFCFNGKSDWPAVTISQSSAFQAVVNGKTLSPNRKMAKNPDDPSINVHEVEAIFLAFQLWSLAWHRHQALVHTDSTTAVAGLQDSTL